MNHFLTLIVALALLISCKRNKPKPFYEIKVGEEISFEVLSNPTTHYYWEWTNEEQIRIASLKLRIYKNPVFKSKIGFFGREEWTFVGKMKGTDTLKLKLRTYESDLLHQPISDSFSIAISIN